jgi:hypothetical protein
MIRFCTFLVTMSVSLLVPNTHPHPHSNTHTHTLTPLPHRYTDTQIHIHTHKRTHTHTHTHTHPHILRYTYTYTYTNTCTYMILRCIITSNLALRFWTCCSPSSLKTHYCDFEVVVSKNRTMKSDV